MICHKQKVDIMICHKLEKRYHTAKVLLIKQSADHKEGWFKKSGKQYFFFVKSFNITDYLILQLF